MRALRGYEIFDGGCGLQLKCSGGNITVLEKFYKFVSSELTFYEVTFKLKNKTVSTYFKKNNNGFVRISLRNMSL